MYGITHHRYGKGRCAEQKIECMPLVYESVWWHHTWGSRLLFADGVGKHCSFAGFKNPPLAQKFGSLLKDVINNSSQCTKVWEVTLKWIWKEKLKLTLHPCAGIVACFSHQSMTTTFLFQLFFLFLALDQVVYLRNLWWSEASTSQAELATSVVFAPPWWEAARTVV